MALRCFLFSSDEGTLANLRQILDSLGVDAESCSDATQGAEKITNQPFQIVIIDWDQQPEAGVLLNTARERKASERPLTLAVVSNDASAPRALQAGANSLLRKPIVMTQAKETLTTARDLLRAKQGSANAQAAAAGSHPAPGATATLRAGEFLQTPTLAPSAQFETEMPVVPPTTQSADSINSLKNLEPMAGVVSSKPIEPTPAARTSAPFPGLQSIVKSRSIPQSAPTPVAPAAPRGNPELAGYHDLASISAPPAPAPKIVTKVVAPPPPLRPRPRPAPERPQAAVSSYLTEELEQEKNAKAASGSLKKPAIIIALVLAACAIVAAPQAPWHAKLQGLWNHGRRAAHAWFYPQPATPAQAPVTHENFARAGDEYKLPVAEPIPDSTTDPSKIQVVPVIDPTKKPSADQGDQSATPDTSPIDAGTQSPADQAPAALAAPNQAPVGQTLPPAAAMPQPTMAAPAASQPAAAQTSATSVPASGAVNPPHATTPIPATNSPTPVTTPAKKYSESRDPTAPGYVPPSLRTQLAPPATTDASTSKALTTVLPSIEPVPVTEAAERALLISQPVPAYPANAKGQQGSVTLQVLVGRDGTVQDAKFVQGSFLFARSAIDGVRQWKFKPYLMNGSPVSVQVPLTIKFSPNQ